MGKMSKSLKDIIVLIFTVSLVLSSASFAAEGQDGKLRVICKDPEATIYLDNLQIGKGNVWVESIAPGDYKLSAITSTGDVIFAKKITISAGEPTVVEIGKEVLVFEKAGAAGKAEEHDLTPTFTIYWGSHSMALSAAYVEKLGAVSGQKVDDLYAFGVEINKNLLKSVDVSLGFEFMGGKVSGNSLNLFPIYYNGRYSWKTDGLFKAMYAGGGGNISVWGGQLFYSSVTGTYGSVANQSGYQYFIGGYTGQWGYFGSIQTELGLSYFAGYFTPAGENVKHALSTKGLYLKVGWAF